MATAKKKADKDLSYEPFGFKDRSHHYMNVAIKSVTGLQATRVSTGVRCHDISPARPLPWRM